jgi:Flp pilus assembly CpaE family ATPase
LITTPEISAVHNTSRFLKIADTVGYTEKITLVLNRANTGVKTESLEQQLDLRVAASIVSSGRVVVEAANRGVPVLLADPNGEEEITRGLTHVVELVAGAERPQPSAAGRAGGPFLKGRGQRSGLAFWRGSGR